jgi:hypothetical protein
MLSRAQRRRLTPKVSPVAGGTPWRYPLVILATATYLGLGALRASGQSHTKIPWLTIRQGGIGQYKYVSGTPDLSMKLRTRVCRRSTVVDSVGFG